MLTLGQQIVIESFAKDLIKLIRQVIETKPIKRISRRRVKGKYVDSVFYSPVTRIKNVMSGCFLKVTLSGKSSC